MLTNYEYVNKMLTYYMRNFKGKFQKNVILEN